MGPPSRTARGTTPLLSRDSGVWAFSPTWPLITPAMNSEVRNVSIIRVSSSQWVCGSLRFVDDSRAHELAPARGPLAAARVGR